MWKSISLGFASGVVGGIANMIFLVLAEFTGLTVALDLDVPSFAQAAVLYKQVFWGGLWGILLILPVMPRSWLIRGVLLGITAALANMLIFFPLATTDAGGPGLFGQRVGALMPLFVLTADVLWGLVASRFYSKIQD